MVESPQSCVLVATLGGQPQVVTFALDDLLARDEQVDEVMVVHVAPETLTMQASLRCLAGQFAGGCYAGRPCQLRSVVIGSGAGALADITDEVAAEATWQTLHSLLGRLKSEGRRLHLVATGGPRLIGLMAMSAATLLFDHQDRLWHLYTPRPLREAARGGAILHAGPDSDVRLIQVPMAPWGAYFPALRDLASATSAQALTARIHWMDEGERARCRAVESRLTPRQVEVLRDFAAGMTPQDVAEHLAITLKTVDSHKTVILDQCRIAWGAQEDQRLTYHDLRRWFERYYSGAT
ncbi:MAG: histidine kinase [Anaerolineae bacterium]|nr:histidine kinase [Anaerolineae bacterium]